MKRKLKNIFNSKKPKYSFYDHPDHPDQYSIKVSFGKYADVIYRYGKIKITDEDTHGKLSYSFQIEDAANHTKEDLMKDPAFGNLLGDIAADIIEKNQFTIGQNDKE